jgi:hypothetical protein
MGNVGDYSGYIAASYTIAGATLGLLMTYTAVKFFLLKKKLGSRNK